MWRFRGCRRYVFAAPGSSALNEAVEASRPRARLLGLAGLARQPEFALVIPRCRSVHTVGMRFPIDIVVLWGWPLHSRVVSVHDEVGPGQIVSCRGGDPVAMLELPAGEATRLRLWRGRPLVVCPWD